MAKAARGPLPQQVYVCQGKDTGGKAFQKVKREQEGDMWVGLMGICLGAWTGETQAQGLGNKLMAWRVSHERF